MKKMTIIVPLSVLCAWGVLTAREGRAPTETEYGASEASSSRAPLRAYYTAPPVIPHVVTSGNNNECKVCHAKAMKIAGRTSVPSPHLEMSNCQQCHVGRQQFNESAEFILTANSWEGLQEPKNGTRAFQGAPPTIPHRSFLRENCTGCHQREHPNPAVRFDHPERTNCRQCHVTEKGREF